MLAQRSSQGNGRALIKEYPHSGGDLRAFRRVFEYGADLIQTNAGEPLDKLGGLGAVFEVLEQRGDGYARATKHPGSADPFGVSLDNGASGPVDHVLNGSIVASMKTCSPPDESDQSEEEPVTGFDLFGAKLFERLQIKVVTNFELSHVQFRLVAVSEQRFIPM